MAALGVGGPDRERRGGGAFGVLGEAARWVTMMVRCRIDCQGGRNGDANGGGGEGEREKEEEEDEEMLVPIEYTKWVLQLRDGQEEEEKRPGERRPHQAPAAWTNNAGCYR